MALSITLPKMEITKDESLLIFIIKNRIECSITELMKLCYLIELAFYKKYNKKRLTDYAYIRYNYWPFENALYRDVNVLNTQGILQAKMYQTPYWEDLWKYSLSQMTEEVDAITQQIFSNDDEKQYCSELLAELANFNASELTKISYETSPMKKLWATLLGNEHLWATLNFDD